MGHLYHGYVSHNQRVHVWNGLLNRSTTNQMTDDWKITFCAKRSCSGLRSHPLRWFCCYVGLRISRPGGSEGSTTQFPREATPKLRLVIFIRQEGTCRSNSFKTGKESSYANVGCDMLHQASSSGIPVVSAGIPVFCREKGGEPPTFGRRQQQRSAVGTGGCKGPRSRMARQRFLKPI